MRRIYDDQWSCTIRKVRANDGAVYVAAVPWKMIDGRWAEIGDLTRAQAPKEFRQWLIKQEAWQ